MRKRILNGVQLSMKCCKTFNKRALFLIITAFLFISTVSAQEQKISIKQNNKQLSEVLNEIESKSGYSILVRSNDVNLKQRVSIDVVNKNVDEILSILFKNKGINYKINGKSISVFIPQKTTDKLITPTNQKNVSGTVTDEKGEPIIGASILIKGESKGTISDLNGKFTLDVQSDATIKVSYIGYISKELAINNQSQLKIILNEDSRKLDEVVVVGYGTMKKSDLTGASVSANLAAFKEAPNVSILQSLQGSVPGLNIGQTNQSGQEASISIRGASTLNGNTSPLIVVDGIIYNGRFSDINPADVASAEVLKDASSKAIYGSQAANGVILITTKNGKKGEKPTFTYSGSVTNSTPTINAKLLDRDAFLQKIRDIEWKKAYTEESGYTEINPAWNFTLSDLNVPLTEGFDAGNNFDWFKANTQSASITNHTFGAAGGSDKTSFYMSAGYTNQKGQIINDDYSRWTLRLNLDTKINNWFTLGANTSATFADFSGEAPNMAMIARTSPLVLPRNSDGDLVINPLADSNTNPLLPSTNDNLEKQNRFVGNFYGEIQVPWIKGLTYRLNYGNSGKFFKAYTSSIYAAGQTGSASKANASQIEQTLDNIVNYTQKIGDHNVNATFVYGFNTVDYERTSASGTGFSDLGLSYNKISAATVQTIESNAWNESALYQMLRVGYNYKSKYLLTTTIRRDGFSGFSKNNKTAIFPSVGLGWVASEEKFFKIPFISYLKFRGSYGENGNKVTNYSSLARVSSDLRSMYVFGDGSSPYMGQFIQSIANNDLKWEKTKGINAGLDFQLLDNRISGNVEYYNSNTYDLLWAKILPQVSGFNTIMSNIGQINNRGVEFSVQATPVKTKDFEWEIGVNFSLNRNKIVTLTGKDEDGDGKEDDLIANGLFIGKPIGTIYDYQVDGIWQIGDTIPAGFEVGSYKVVDQNNDGKITPDKDRVVLGNREADYRFGIQNTFMYKQFTLRCFIRSIQGGKNSFLSANIPTGGMDSKGNATNTNWFDFYDYWSPTNPDAKFANKWVGSPVKNDANLYEQRSFLRLQDISLSYDLNKKVLQKIGISNLKIYASGKNLLTFTKWDGWDPETGQGITSTDAYPVMKSFTLGLEVSF